MGITSAIGSRGKGLYQDRKDKAVTDLHEPGMAGLWFHNVHFEPAKRRSSHRSRRIM